jgi:L-lysine 2,3-aminomutase
MLAIGTSDYLRRKHGDRYCVRLVLNSAPHTTAEEAERVRAWIENESRISGVIVDGGMTVVIWHDQV